MIAAFWLMVFYAGLYAIPGDGLLVFFVSSASEDRERALPTPISADARREIFIVAVTIVIAAVAVLLEVL